MWRELALTGLLGMMERKLTLSWAICWAVWLGGEVWHLGTVLALLILRLIVRCDEVDCRHLYYWSFRVDVDRATPAELARGWVLVSIQVIYQFSWGRDYLRVVEVLVHMIWYLSSCERRLRIRLDTHGHCIVWICNWSSRSSVPTMHLVLSFFLSHIALLVALVVAHQGTFVEGNSLGAKWSVEVFGLPGLLRLISPYKRLSRLVVISTLLDRPGAIEWCRHRLIVRVAGLVGTLGRDVTWAFANEDVVALLLADVAQVTSDVTEVLLGFLSLLQHLRLILIDLIIFIIGRNCRFSLLSVSSNLEWLLIGWADGCA